MTISIERAVAKLAEIDLAVTAATTAVVRRGAVIIEREAKREIGHYQDAVGPLPKWKKLAHATLYGGVSPEGHRFPGKVELGYSPPDNPLLRTGAMRDSIRHVVRTGPGYSEAEIGSRFRGRGGAPIALFQERGTSRAPARSFLERAARRKEPEIVKAIGEAAMLAFGVQGAPISKIR